nr:His/Gly/Thr/Pro-type tRNA ligase C-terminal domain-containing protein [Thermoanaerobaculia bacterium]
GAFPLWLAPVQAVVLPVSERFLDYGQWVRDELAAAGLRVEIDDGNEKLGYKIRQAQLRKVPYMLVVGEREAAAGTAAVRLRSGEDRGPVAVPELIAKLREAAAARRAAEL